jgi:dienelactone hydrolase
MKIVTLVASFFLIVAALFTLGAGPVKHSEVTYPEEPPKGNHELSCTVIQPWSDRSGPGNFQYPVIVWANGWCYNEVYGREGNCLAGYKPGLIEWALDGPYIVVAANQWSVQESDVLACAQWITDPESEYEYKDNVDGSKIGLAGHSQGGGAVIKAGDGGGEDITITAVVAMNPYGPAWVNPESQDGPVLLVGGNDDTTTPPDSYQAVWDAIVEAYPSGPGGVNAVLDGCTHNSEAWGEDDEGNTLPWEEAQNVDFGEYQEVTELWWRLHLYDNARSMDRLMHVLSEYPWIQECTENF